MSTTNNLLHYAVLKGYLDEHLPLLRLVCRAYRNYSKQNKIYWSLFFHQPERVLDAQLRYLPPGVQVLNSLLKLSDEKGVRKGLEYLSERLKTKEKVDLLRSMVGWASSVAVIHCHSICVGKAKGKNSRKVNDILLDEVEHQGKSFLLELTDLVDLPEKRYQKLMTRACATEDLAMVEALSRYKMSVGIMSLIPYALWEEEVKRARANRKMVLALFIEKTIPGYREYFARREEPIRREGRSLLRRVLHL